MFAYVKFLCYNEKAVYKTTAYPLCGLCLMLIRLAKSNPTKLTIRRGEKDERRNPSKLFPS